MAYNARKAIFLQGILLSSPELPTEYCNTAGNKLVDDTKKWQNWQKMYIWTFKVKRVIFTLLEAPNRIELLSLPKLQSSIVGLLIKLG